MTRRGLLEVPLARCTLELIGEVALGADVADVDVGLLSPTLSSSSVNWTSRSTSICNETLISMYHEMMRAQIHACQCIPFSVHMSQVKY